VITCPTSSLLTVSVSLSVLGGKACTGMNDTGWRVAPCLGRMTGPRPPYEPGTRAAGLTAVVPAARSDEGTSAPDGGETATRFDAVSDEGETAEPDTLLVATSICGTPTGIAREGKTAAEARMRAENARMI